MSWKGEKVISVLTVLYAIITLPFFFLKFLGDTQTVLNFLQNEFKRPFLFIICYVSIFAILFLYGFIIKDKTGQSEQQSKETRMPEKTRKIIKIILFIIFPIAIGSFVMLMSAQYKAEELGIVIGSFGNTGDAFVGEVHSYIGNKKPKEFSVKRNSGIVYPITNPDVPHIFNRIYETGVVVCGDYNASSSMVISLNLAWIGRDSCFNTYTSHTPLSNCSFGVLRDAEMISNIVLSFLNMHIGKNDSSIFYANQVLKSIDTVKDPKVSTQLSDLKNKLVQFNAANHLRKYLRHMSPISIIANKGNYKSVSQEYGRAVAESPQLQSDSTQSVVDQNTSAGIDTNVRISRIRVKNAKAVVSTTKVNVLFIGIDNQIQLAVQGYTNNNLYADISQGKIEGENGFYIANVFKEGDVFIKVFELTESGQKSFIDSVKFQVKKLPTPPLYITGLITLKTKLGIKIEITKEALLSNRIIKAEYDDFNFKDVFALKNLFVVKSFTLYITPVRTSGNDARRYYSKSSDFTPEMRRAIQILKPGTILKFDDIQVRGVSRDTSARYIPRTEVEIISG